MDRGRDVAPGDKDIYRRKYNPGGWGAVRGFKGLHWHSLMPQTSLKKADPVQNRRFSKVLLI